MSKLSRAQVERTRRGHDLFSERVDHMLDRVGLSEERCLQLANFERVGPDARKKLKGILDKYRKSPHPFTDCVRDNRKRFGNRAENVCAVVKDLIEGTTKWRKGGGHKANMSESVTPCLMLDDDVVTLLAHIDTDALAELLAGGDDGPA